MRAARAGFCGLLMLALSACQAPPMAPPPGAPEATSPGAARWQYSMRYLGLPVGAATLWSRPSAAPRHQLLVGQSHPAFALLAPLQCQAQVEWDADGAPLHFQARWEQGERRRSRDLRFADEVLLHWQEDERRSAQPHVIEAGAPIDLLTLLQRVRDLGDLSQPAEFEVVLGPRADAYRVVYAGRQEVSVGAGCFQDARRFQVTVHAIHHLAEGPVLGPARVHYELAISADERRLPLRLRRELRRGHWVLELEQTAQSISSSS